MNDKDKTKEQLINELTELRKRNEELEKAEFERTRSEGDSYRLADIFKYAHIGVAVGTPQGLFETVNPAYAEMHGYSIGELIGRPVADVYAPKTSPNLPEIVRQANEKGYLSYETLHIRKDGIVFPVQVEVYGVRDETGNVLYQIATVQDITERRRTEDKLVSIMKAVESSSDAIGISDSLGHHFYQNKAFSDLFGYTTAEELEATGGGLSVVKDPEVAKKIFNNIMHGESWVGELEMVTKSGRVFNAFERADAIKDNEGNIIGLVGIITDITDRVEAEKAQRLLSAIVESSDDAIISKDLGDTILSWNIGAQKMYGYSADEIVGKSLSLLVPPEMTDEIPAIMERLKKGETIERYRTQRIRKDGSRIFVSITASPIRDAAGKVFGASAIARDITESKRVEMEREQYFRFFQSSSDLMCIADPNGAFKKTNPACTQTLGYSETELVAKPFVEFVHPDDRQRTLDEMARQLRRGFSLNFENRYLCKDGSVRWLSWRASYDKDEGLTYASARDVTERKHLEEQLRHAQRLESLGTLAGGVAHDFNNILNVIVGYGSMMEMHMSKDDPNTPYIKEIVAAAERATHLTRALLIFGRKQIVETKQVNINELVEGMRKMILRLIGEDIDTNISLSSGKLMVMGDYGQLEQVLMNLATNARDAMPDGGSLSIETALLGMDSEFIDIHGFGKPGKYALITVSDTGEGLDEKTRERIFEPFFTTKGVGKGTGLGLPIVYGIVKQHNGYINCYSELGRGTTFKVYLPVLREELLDVEEAVTSPVKGGNETILIADDDDGVRRLTTELLEMYGYTVIEARDGADAVGKFLDHKERINLVLLDVIMPKKSGREAFEEIRGIQSDVKILFISGYTENIIQRKRIIKDKLQLLQKPVKPKELLAKIREMLDERK